MKRHPLALALALALAGCADKPVTMGPTLLREVTQHYPKDTFTCRAAPPKPQLECAAGQTSCDRSKELADWINALWFRGEDCAAKLTAAGKMVEGASAPAEKNGE